MIRFNDKYETRIQEGHIIAYKKELLTGNYNLRLNDFETKEGKGLDLITAYNLERPHENIFIRLEYESVEKRNKDLKMLDEIMYCEKIKERSDEIKSYHENCVGVENDRCDL